MAKSRKRPDKKEEEEVLNATEVEAFPELSEQVESDIQVVSIEETLPDTVTVEKSVTIVITRDAEGRLVAEVTGRPKRIAGTDDAFSEVTRQLGEEIVKERLI